MSVACRDIAAGEEVTDCYGLPWYNVAKEKRNQIQNKWVYAACFHLI